MPETATVLSPELVLVDPQPGAYPPAPFAVPGTVRPRLTKPAATKPPSRTGDAHGDAVNAAHERLLKAGIDSDVLGSLVPAGKHFRRRARLVPACAAASAVALLVLQL